MFSFAFISLCITELSILHWFSICRLFSLHCLSSRSFLLNYLIWLFNYKFMTRGTEQWTIYYNHWEFWKMDFRKLYQDPEIKMNIMCQQKKFCRKFDIFCSLFAVVNCRKTAVDVKFLNVYEAKTYKIFAVFSVKKGCIFSVFTVFLHFYTVIYAIFLQFFCFTRL